MSSNEKFLKLISGWLVWVTLRLFPHTLHEYGVLCEYKSGCACMQGFTQEFLLGRGEKYWVPNFCLPRPLLAHYAVNAILFY